MGRPLKDAWTNAIKVHYYKNGAAKSTTLVKQVGFNKYTTAQDFIVRLEDRDVVVANKNNTVEPVMGYVVITDAADSSTHYMKKLTKNVIECFDGARYHFDYVLVEEDGVVVGVKMAADAPATIEGVEEES